ncbi:MAG: glycosyltransferase [Pseudomonadota bacterium]
MTRALVHVQHLLGTGHAVRAAAIGQALNKRGVHVTLATGNRLPATVDTTGLEVVDLPFARSADASFDTILDVDDQPIDTAWETRRKTAALDLLRDTAPDILLVETFPLGRRRFRFELIPLMERACEIRSRPLVATSVRDILVRKKDPSKEVAMADLARQLCDLVLVHSDQSVVRLEDSFPPADMISDLIRYTGFVYPDLAGRMDGGDGADEVIVSTGGGAVGRHLLETALAVQASGILPDVTWRYLIGRDLADTDAAGLRAKASDRTIIEPARPDFPFLLERCQLSISQAGYNTVLDILRAGAPTVLVPFAQGDETEQTQRAMALEARGRAALVEEASLTAETLTAGIDRALSLPRATETIALDGAAASADILLKALTELRTSNAE